MSKTLADELYQNGYAILSFHNSSALREIQKFLSGLAGHDLIELHRSDLSQDAHVELVKNMTDRLVESSLVRRLFLDNADILHPFVGPDVDIQRRPHLRVSRPHVENDLIHWHRDTFYGNSPWELNFWFPVFPIESGAGLCLLPKSHRQPSQNVREYHDANDFRKTVTKGSAANQIGYVYLPKIDDTISSMQEQDTVVLAPKVGEAVMFMGCGVHRAQNKSNKTRVTLDIRIRNCFAPTQTAPDYYVPLVRSAVGRSVAEFLNHSKMV